METQKWTFLIKQQKLSCSIIKHYALIITNLTFVNKVVFIKMSPAVFILKAISSPISL